MNKVITYFAVAMILWWGGLQSISEHRGGDHSIIVISLIIFQALWYKICWSEQEFSWIGLFTGLIPISLAVYGLSAGNQFTLGFFYILLLAHGYTGGGRSSPKSWLHLINY